MGIGLIRGLGAFGMGAAAGAASAFDSYKRQRELENALSKALGKNQDVREPSFKDFWDRAPGNKALSGTQAPAPVADATPSAVAPQQDAAAAPSEDKQPDNSDTMNQYQEIRSGLMPAEEDYLTNWNE